MTNGVPPLFLICCSISSAVIGRDCAGTSVMSGVWDTLISRPSPEWIWPSSVSLPTLSTETLISIGTGWRSIVEGWLMICRAWAARSTDDVMYTVVPGLTGCGTTSRISPFVRTGTVFRENPNCSSDFLGSIKKSPSPGFGIISLSILTNAVLVFASYRLTLPIYKPRLSGASLPMNARCRSPNRYPEVKPRLNARRRLFISSMGGLVFPAAMASRARRYADTTTATYSADFIRPSILSEAMGEATRAGRCL